MNQRNADNNQIEVNKKDYPSWLTSMFSVLAAQTIIVLMGTLCSAFIIYMLLNSLTSIPSASSWHTYLTDQAIKELTHQTFIKLMMAMAISFGLIGLLGIICTPPLIRVFVKIFKNKEHKLPYRRWVFMANFAGWFVALVSSVILWMIPGGQFLAIPLIWALATMITTVIMHHHLKNIHK